MANISRDTFDPNKGYRKVIWQQTGAALDFDFNEAQDLARWERDRLAAQLAGGLHLLGSAGRVTPDGSTSRSVVIEGGFAVHNDELVYIPDVATLKVFNDATTTGVHSSLVYVEYGDVEVTSAEDPDIEDPTFGESTARLKRDVKVKVAIGSKTLPSPAPGYSNFKLAVVTHDFDADGTIIQSDDIAQEPYGLTPGELSGYGPDRTLRLVSNRRSGDVATELDTRVNWESGKLLSVKNHGTERFYVNHQGKGWFAADLAVGGNIEVSGQVNGVDLAAFKASYDAHNHDDRYYTEAEADSRFVNITGATFTGAVGVARDGDAFQFNNTGDSSRSILRVLRKGAVRAELMQETNDNLSLRTRTGPAGEEISHPVLTIVNSTGEVRFDNPPTVGGVDFLLTGSAGAGISVSKSGNNLAITNTDRGSSQNIFKNIANAEGTTQFSATANNDTLRFASGGILSLAFDPATKKVTYSASLSAGTGISVSGNKITNTGIISAQAGSGISVSGTNPLHISNTDRGSSQNIFKNIANGSGATQFSATVNNDTLRIASGANISVSFDSATKKVTIAGTGQWPDADTVDGWHANALRDWNNLLNKPSTFTPSSHNHDDRYYTKSEADARYLGSSTSTLYIDVTQEASLQEDGAIVLGPTNGYNIAISGKHIIARNNGAAAPLYLNSGSGYVYARGYRVLTEEDRSQFSTVGHHHDDRYYTESEVNSFLAGKADTNHNHDGRYLRLHGGSLTGNINFQPGAGISSSIGVNDRYMVCPYRASLNPFDSGPNNGLTLESDDGIHFIETDSDTVIGWMSLNSSVFRWNGTIYANAFFERSSREYKTDIVAFEDDALALIDSVRIVRFHYKEQKYDYWHIGIVAEDTDRRLTGPTGKEFDIPSAVAVLYAGMQEVSRRNRERDARVDALEKENRDLRSEVATLKAMVGDLLHKVEALAA